MIDIKKVTLRFVGERKNKTTVVNIRDPKEDIEILKNEDLRRLVEKISNAKKSGKQIIFMMGAHLIKEGLSLYIIDLIKKGYITHIAMNGAFSIHDFEIAKIGATSEDVGENIKDGSFGMWTETSAINEYLKGTKEGYGKTLGKAINFLEYKNYSILHAAYESNIPATVHIAIGTDINHMYPNFLEVVADAAKASYMDFLYLADSISKLDGGVIVNIGSAVIMPEVFLKALSIARNLGNKVENVTRANLDMNAHYRPRSNILERPFENGEYFDIRERHEKTIPTLHHLLTK